MHFLPYTKDWYCKICSHSFSQKWNLMQKDVYILKSWGQNIFWIKQPLHSLEISMDSQLMCESIPSLVISPPGKTLTARGVRFLPNYMYLCLGSGFWIREIFYSFERRMWESWFDHFKETVGSLQKQVFLCVFISIFEKTVQIIYCVFNKLDYF